MTFYTRDITLPNLVTYDPDLPSVEGNAQPVITDAIGADSIVSGAAGAYVPATGVTASDAEDGNITANIVITGSVTNYVGVHTLSYNVSDSGALAADEVTRNVTVSPEAGFFITNITVDPVLVGDGYLGTGWTDTAPVIGDQWDYEGLTTLSNLTVTINPDGGVIIPEQTVTESFQFRVIQADGTIGAIATYTSTIDVVAPPSEQPVITDSVGDESVDFGDVSSYNPATGVTANDAEDGDITANIVVTGSVNYRIGPHLLNYNVVDSGSLAADQVTRIATTVPPNGFTYSNIVINQVSAGAEYFATGYTPSPVVGDQWLYQIVSSPSSLPVSVSSTGRVTLAGQTVEETIFYELIQADGTQGPLLPITIPVPVAPEQAVGTTLYSNTVTLIGSAGLTGGFSIYSYYNPLATSAEIIGEDFFAGISKVELKPLDVVYCQLLDGFFKLSMITSSTGELV